MHQHQHPTRTLAVGLVIVAVLEHCWRVHGRLTT